MFHLAAKTTEAKAFMQPLMDLLLAVLREHAPTPAEGSAIRQLHTREAELQRAREKLEAHGLHLSPQRPTPTADQVHLSQPGAPPAWRLLPAPRTRGTTSRDRTRTIDPRPSPSTRPSLARDIANWVKFDDIIQESATAIIKLLQTSGATHPHFTPTHSHTAQSIVTHSPPCKIR